MRILHAPVNVGNQPWVLSRYERALGVHSDLIVNYTTWLGYPADRILSDYGKFGFAPLLRRAWHGFGAPFRYDALHYYFGRTLLNWEDWPSHYSFPFFDARLAKWLGRKVFFTLQGCDVRIASESNRRNKHTMCREDGCSAYATCIASLDAARRKMMETVLPLADRVFYLNPELGHYVQGGQFMPYANVDVEAIRPLDAAPNRRPLILHAPSDPSIKGTALIEAALEKLRSRFDFEYLAVQGFPHARAMELYRRADLVIDQVLAGWYGGFAVEVMAMGKPVAAYLRDEDLGFLPDSMRRDLPILRLRPDKIFEDLAAAFERRADWPSIGTASRRYVMTWHNPAYIASAMVAAYRDPQSRFDLPAAVLSKQGHGQRGLTDRVR